MAIAAELIDSLELAPNLFESNFGYACLIRGWTASSRTGNVTGENTLRGGEEIDEEILGADDEELGVDAENLWVGNVE